MPSNVPPTQPSVARPVTPTLEDRRQLPKAPIFRHTRDIHRLAEGNNFRSIAATQLAVNHIQQSSHDGWKQMLFPSCNHIYNEENGKRETIDSLLKGNKKDVWEKALSNEWGRLAQGNKYGVQAQDAIDFIFKKDVPSDRDITYAQFICDHRPLKTEPW